MLTTLCIDPGHGGPQPGCSGNGLIEKELTLQLACMMADICDSLYHGVAVHVTREGVEQTSLPLAERGAISQKVKADMVCVLHFDTNPDPAVGDLSTYYLAGDDVARVVAQELEHVAPMALRPHAAIPRVAEPTGWTSHAYNVLHTHAGRHPVLVECAFLSNPRHAHYLKSTHGIPALAAAIMSGLTPGLELIEAQKLKGAVLHG